MRVREPFNAGSHFIGFLLAGLGTWYLLQMASGGAQLLAFGIYGATLLLLYGASTCYHGLPLGAARAAPAPDPGPHRDLLPDRGDLYTRRRHHLARIGRPRPPRRELDHRRGGHPVQDPVA